jgi:hypothetical protein
VSSTARIAGVVIAAALTGGLAACGTSSQRAGPATAGPASAGAIPVRVQPNAAGWSGMVQRPAVIYVGMGGAPVARRLTWRHWGSPTAWASGKLDRYWLQRGPISGWRPTTYMVTVRLQDIQVHNGQPSYRKMTDTYVNHQGKAKSLQFTFSIRPGGLIPNWNPTRPGPARRYKVPQYA